MEWNDFYTRFYEMDGEEQMKAIRALSRPGPAHEVAEIICECEEEAASVLMRMAVDAGMRFSPEEILSLLHCIEDESALQTLVNRRSARFSAEQFGELEAASFDEDFLDSVARADGVRRSGDGDYSPIPRIALVQELPPIRLSGLLDIASGSRKPKKKR